jgi:[ribosomal protein S5]-alanine N-acetyltransferase
MPRAFLIGRRVHLRPMEEEDALTFTEWMNDPELRSFLTIRFPLSLKAEKEWINGMTVKGTPRDIPLAIERRSDGRLIGSVGLHQIDWVTRRASTGIIICPASMRGKGYGTEAKNLLIDYAFGELGLHSLWALAVEGNAPSVHALEKQGYERNGLYREAVLVKGVRRNLIYFDLLREEWERMRKPPRGPRGRTASPKKPRGRK